jgi:hypothetical protein
MRGEVTLSSVCRRGARTPIGASGIFVFVFANKFPLSKPKKVNSATIVENGFLSLFLKEIEIK